MDNKVRLVATSKHLSPAQIESAIGVRADRCWAAGDKRDKSAALEKESGLIVESGLSGDLDIELHIEGLMRLVAGKELELLRFSEAPECEIQLSCVIYCRGAPPLNFENRVIRWVASIGASLDIDIYLM